MKASYKLIVQAGYFTAIVILILVGVVTYRYCGTLLENTEWMTEGNQISRTSERLLFLFKRAESEQRELIYHRDSASIADQFYLNPYLSQIDSIQKCLSQLEQLLSRNDIQKKKLYSIRSLTQMQIDLMNHAIQLKSYNSKAAFQKFVTDDQGNQTSTMVEIEKMLSNLSVSYNQRVTESTESLHNLVLKARNSILFLLIGFLGLAIVSFVFIYQYEHKDQSNQQEIHKLNLQLEQKEEDLKSSNRELVGNHEELQTIYKQLEKLKEEFAAIVMARTAKIKRANNRLVAEVIKRKRIGEALKKSEERFRIALYNAPIVVFNQDKSLRYSWVYNNLSSTITAANMVGKTDYDLLSPKDAEHVVLIKQHVLDTGKGTNQEIHLTIDRKRVNYLLSIEPLFNNQMQVVGITCAAYDITQLKHAEDLLRETLKELKHRNHELDNYVYKVSHDLRAPLVSILGLINLVKTEQSLDSWKNYLGLIENRVNKLDDFIKSVLNHSRTLNSEINITRIDFEQIVSACSEELRYLPNLEKLRITVYNKTNVDFYSDDLRLGIVFKNFVSNAVKYLNPFAEQSFLHFDIEVTEQHAKILIEDNGSGIEEQYLTRIFDMFFRGTSKSDGSGLGLYIVRQTIERLEGSITVESEIGKGTRFRILLANLKGQVVSG